MYLMFHFSYVSIVLVYHYKILVKSRSIVPFLILGCEGRDLLQSLKVLGNSVGG